MKYINVEAVLGEIDRTIPLKEQVYNYFEQPENKDKIDVLFLVTDDHVMEYIKKELGVVLSTGSFYRYIPCEVDNGIMNFVKV